jgi:hypothetical protein
MKPSIQLGKNGVNPAYEFAFAFRGLRAFWVIFYLLSGCAFEFTPSRVDAATPDPEKPAMVLPVEWPKLSHTGAPDFIGIEFVTIQPNLISKGLEFAHETILGRVPSVVPVDVESSEERKGSSEHSSEKSGEKTIEGYAVHGYSLGVYLLVCLAGGVVGTALGASLVFGAIWLDRKIYQSPPP